MLIRPPPIQDLWMFNVPQYLLYCQRFSPVVPQDITWDSNYGYKDKNVPIFAKYKSLCQLHLLMLYLNDKQTTPRGYL